MFSATSCFIQCLVFTLSFTDKISVSRILAFVYRAIASCCTLLIQLSFRNWFSFSSFFFFCSSIKREFGGCCCFFFFSLLCGSFQFVNCESLLSSFGTFVLLLVCHVDLAKASLIYVIQSLRWARACNALFTLIIITRILPSPIFKHSILPNIRL